MRKTTQREEPFMSGRAMRAGGCEGCVFEGDESSLSLQSKTEVWMKLPDLSVGFFEGRVGTPPTLTPHTTLTPPAPLRLPTPLKL